MIAEAFSSPDQFHRYAGSQCFCLLLRQLIHLRAKEAHRRSILENEPIACSGNKAVPSRLQ
jgi:hypothetical protein